MNSCVCEVPGMNHSLRSNTHSLSLGRLLFLLCHYLTSSSAAHLNYFYCSFLLAYAHAFQPPDLYSCCSYCNACLFSLFHSHHSKSYCLHCSAQMPPPPGSLFSQELCALHKNTDNRSTTRGRSLPTLASFTFCLGQTQTSRAFFSPTPQYTKVPTRW